MLKSISHQGCFGKAIESAWHITMYLLTFLYFQSAVLLRPNYGFRNVVLRYLLLHTCARVIVKWGICQALVVSNGPTTERQFSTRLSVCSSPIWSQLWSQTKKKTYIIVRVISTWPSCQRCATTSRWSTSAYPAYQPFGLCKVATNDAIEIHQTYGLFWAHDVLIKQYSLFLRRLGSHIDHVKRNFVGQPKQNCPAA